MGNKKKSKKQRAGRFKVSWVEIGTAIGIVLTASAAFLNTDLMASPDCATVIDEAITQYQVEPNSVFIGDDAITCQVTSILENIEE